MFIERILRTDFEEKCRNCWLLQEVRCRNSILENWPEGNGVSLSTWSQSAKSNKATWMCLKMMRSTNIFAQSHGDCLISVLKLLTSHIKNFPGVEGAVQKHWHRWKRKSQPLRSHSLPEGIFNIHRIARTNIFLQSQSAMTSLKKMWKKYSQTSIQLGTRA